MSEDEQLLLVLLVMNKLLVDGTRECTVGELHPEDSEVLLVHFYPVTRVDHIIIIIITLFSYLPRLAGPELQLRYFTSW